MLNATWETKAIIRLFARLFIYSFLGWFLLNHNPFGISEKSDKAFQDAFLKLAAPWYSEQAKEDILVVLINDKSIENLYKAGYLAANEWPLLYKDHAALLKNLVAYSPKALFVDIYFKKERSIDSSFPSLVRTIERANRSNIPLFFAGGYSDESYSPIQNKLSDIANLSVNGWEGFGHHYPLNVNGKKTAAAYLYEVACSGNSPLRGCNLGTLQNNFKDDDVVLPYWGSSSAAAIFPEMTSSSCKASANSFLESIRQLASGFFNGLFNYSHLLGESTSKCAYHKVLYIDQIIQITKAGSYEQREQLKQAISDKVVLYGLSLEGLHDNVQTPVHGLLPGVMLHAMVLDNLMQFGSNYLHSTTDAAYQWSLYSWILAVMLITLRIYSQERKTPDYNPETDTRRLILYSLGLIVLLPSVFIGFLIFRYEPINFFTFFSLIMFMVEMIKANKVNKLLRNNPQ